MLVKVKAKIDDNGAILCLSEYCNHNGDICPNYDKCELYIVSLTKFEDQYNLCQQITKRK